MRTSGVVAVVCEGCRISWGALVNWKIKYTSLRLLHDHNEKLLLCSIGKFVAFIFACFSGTRHVPFDIKLPSMASCVVPKYVQIATNTNPIITRFHSSWMKVSPPLVCPRLVPRLFGRSEFHTLYILKHDSQMDPGSYGKRIGHAH